MIDKNKHNNNPDFDLAYEKLFMPELYSSEENYTLSKAFAISNEQLDQLFSALDLIGKKILTVGSSGDQALNAILKGSKDITIIDANIFARPYIEYKLAVIKTFDYETFDDIFIRHDFFSWRVYSKISHLLSKSSQIFWDKIMLDLSEDNYGFDFSGKVVKEKMLIVDHRDRHSAFYRNKNAYNKLQSLLNSNDLTISFLTAEFQEFPSVLKNKYDIIYLSNIFDYYKGANASLFEEVLDKLYQNNLEANGMVFVNYSFNKKFEESPTHIGDHKIEHVQLDRFADGEKNEDTAWVIKKTAPFSEEEICK